MKRRNKKYKPRDIRVPTIVGTQNIFAAPMKLLSDIRHSYVLADGKTVYIPSTDGAEVFDAIKTLRLFADVLSDFASLAGEHLDTSSLNILAARLEADMPIDDGCLTPVDRVFEVGHRLSNRLTPDQCLMILDGRNE